MIIDLQKFIAQERPCWTELEKSVDILERDLTAEMNFEQIKRFHYLYGRTAADLAKLTTFSSEPELRRYLESLVARAYGQLHENTGRRARPQPLKWFLTDFPRAFRRHFAAFVLSTLLFISGSLFGGLAMFFDAEAKPVLMPFDHLMQTPAERVASEEKVRSKDRLAGQKSSFSSFLISNNTRVSILTLAMGVTWGVGTTILLFSNGIMLGAVCVDYVMAGQSLFLAGWLLPHGSVEIPSILIAGQGGLILAHAIIGYGNPLNISARLRQILPDLTLLIYGVAVLLIWAGIIEAFFSQYHQPVLPYWVKITFGTVQLGLLTLFLAKSGREPKDGGVKP